jgi:hypothetical protein
MISLINGYNFKIPSIALLIPAKAAKLLIKIGKVLDKF